jgi:8-hydroxy-5-deazaflavin:NADPH oxidoreductase
MSSISIIGSGNMASAIGALAVKGGNAVEVIGRDAAKAADLAGTLGNGATAGTWGAAPAGDVVILALPYANAAAVVSQYGDALAGKIIVDITNPFNASATGMAIPDDTSVAQMVAKAAPANAHVVKAFNTLFRDVLAAGGPLDVFMAGDDAQAKASLSAFITSLGLRPQDAGDLSMAHWLEGAGLLAVGVGRSAGNFNFSLGVNVG